MSRRLEADFADAGAAAAATMVDAAVTVAARVPILATHLVLPSVEGCVEWQRAVSEKSIATWDAAAATVFAWQDLAWRSLISPITPVGMAHEALALVRIASEPGRRTVRANALRFGGE